MLTFWLSVISWGVLGWSGNGSGADGVPVHYVLFLSLLYGHTQHAVRISCLLCVLERPEEASVGHGVHDFSPLRAGGELLHWRNCCNYKANF